MTRDSDGRVLDVRINGAPFVTSVRPDRADLDGHLRGIALAWSPVAIEGADETDRRAIVERLRLLSRTPGLPARECRTPAEAGVLLADPTAPAPGTWVCTGLEGWPPADQDRLAKRLSRLHEDRLHQRARDDEVPRVICLRAGGRNGMLPPLARCVSFFHIVLIPRSVPEV